MLQLPLGTSQRCWDGLGVSNAHKVPENAAPLPPASHPKASELSATFPAHKAGARQLLQLGKWRVQVLCFSTLSPGLQPSSWPPKSLLCVHPGRECLCWCLGVMLWYTHSADGLTWRDPTGPQHCCKSQSTSLFFFWQPFVSKVQDTAWFGWLCLRSAVLWRQIQTIGAPQT